MDKFNFHEEFNQRSVMSYFVPNVIGNRAKEVVDAPGYDVENMEVKFIVNGIEFDAKETLEKMWAIREEEIRKCAMTILQDSVGDLMSELQLFSDRIEDTFPW